MVDASFKDQNGATSLACICRDQQNQWVKGIALHTYSTSALMAETMAITAALAWAVREGWQDVQIICDCQRAVNGINQQCKAFDEMGNHYLFCRDLLSQIVRGRLSKGPRDQVKEADVVARQAMLHLTTSRREDWSFISILDICVLNLPPNCLTDVICSGSTVSFGDNIMTNAGTIDLGAQALLLNPT